MDLNAAASLLVDEAVKAVINQAVPLVVGAVLLVAGKIGGLALSEILLSRRVLVLILAVLLAILVAPEYTAWVALGVFAALLFTRLGLYLRGPDKRPSVVFTGFYRMDGPHGRLARSGASSVFDTEFLLNLERVLGGHSIQREVPIPVVEFRPPRIVYSLLTYTSFGRLMRRYAKRCLAVMWGTVSDDGNVLRLDVVVDPGHLAGGERGAKLFSAFEGIVQCTDVDSVEKLNFVGNCSAALWGHTFCGQLSAGGKWRAALAAAVDSRRIVEDAILRIHEKGGPRSVAESDIVGQRLLPMFELEAARSRLQGDRPVDAVQDLVTAIVMHPLWPFSTENEYESFYNARYEAGLVKRAPVTKAVVAAYLDRVADRAMLDGQSSLELFLEWLAVHGKDIPNLEERIDAWFESIVNAHGDSPFPLIYWADAVKIPFRILPDDEKAELAPPDVRPLGVLVKAIEKCESAYAIAPHMHVISAKLMGMYLALTGYFEESTPQYQLARAKLDEHITLFRRYMDENMPMEMYADPGRADSNKERTPRDGGNGDPPVGRSLPPQEA